MIKWARKKYENFLFPEPTGKHNRQIYPHEKFPEKGARVRSWDVIHPNMNGNPTVFLSRNGMIQSVKPPAPEYKRPERAPRNQSAFRVV